MARLWETGRRSGQSWFPIPDKPSQQGVLSTTNKSLQKLQVNIVGAMLRGWPGSKEVLNLKREGIEEEEKVIREHLLN